MKTIIKLVIALAVLNAVARGGFAYYNYYQLKDGTQELLTFGVDATTEELRDQVVAKAAELDLPVDPDNVDIRREGVRTSALVQYTQPVEFFPTYVRPIEFSFTVDTVSMRAGKVTPTRR
jgi:hypothetical protein